MSLYNIIYKLTWTIKEGIIERRYYEKTESR